jgi:1-acyl-sn-glycerol-3-phosphate acyltransferase
MGEPWTRTWRRRAITIPSLVLMTLVALALLPLLLVGALFALPFERRRFTVARCVGFFTAYLVGEVAFLLFALGQWIAAGPGKRGRQRLAHWTEGLGNAWGAALMGMGRLFFNLDVHVHGLESIEGGRGPLIVFPRHASMGDTPLAPVYLGQHAGLRLRYVAKRELRNDPIFDVIGGRIRSCFVDRESARAGREIAAIASLLEDLSPRDAVLLYPEGTRFSEEKRTRALARLGCHLPPALAAKARAMRHVLPPRLGGPVALLEHNPGADVVFVAHVGYEGVATFRDLLSGRAIGRRIEVDFRRVPFAELPKGREALTEWLYDQWARVDAWIDAHRDLAESAAAPAHDVAQPPTATAI